MPLLQSLDTTNLCRDCSYISMGWLADEKRLFFTLNLVYGDPLGAGTYIVTEDAKVIPTPEIQSSRAGPAAHIFRIEATTTVTLRTIRSVLGRTYKNYQPEEHVWGKDLQSGEEKELFMLPARTVPSSEPNVTLNILGWAEEK